MRKTVRNNNVLYEIHWSKFFQYERIHASRILPELPGIMLFFEHTEMGLKSLLCLGCWRDGLRMATKNFFDPFFTKYPHLLKVMKDKELVYKYCIVDTSPHDLKDIMYWIIKEYTPLYNNNDEFEDSQRYKEIFINEKQDSHPNRRMSE